MISIVIPTFNSISKMDMTLESLRAIPEKVPHEVIFVDDQSKDGTFDVLASECQSNENWKIYRLPENSGSAAKPRNYGLEVATGEFLFFLDSDDILIPEGLANSYAHAVKFDSDAVRNSLQVVAPDGTTRMSDRVPGWDKIKDSGSRLRAITKYQSLTCSFLMRRDVVMENNIRFMESRRIGEDITFSSEVLTKCQRLSYRDVPIRKYVKNDDEEGSVTQKLTSSNFRDFIEAWSDVEEILGTSGVSFIKEHGHAAMDYALRQFILFKTEELNREVFNVFSEFCNKHWNNISTFKFSRRLHELVLAARDADYEQFVDACKIRLVLAGHDLKFMNEILPELKKRYKVRIDKWTGHTTHDKAQSRELLEWTDYVWVEWLLGAAVWYSKNVTSRHRLVIRAHRSELTVDYGLDLQLSKVAKIISIAPHSMNDFSDRFDIPFEKFELIPNAFDVEGYKTEPDNAAERRFQIAMIGTVPALKGFHRAIELLAQLRERDERFQLNVYGKKHSEYVWVMNSESERKYYSMCDSRIAELGLEDSIHYQGWIDTKESLRNVGYALSLSDFEGMQVAPGEAFCAGGQGLFLPWRGVQACYPSEFIFESIEEMAEYIQDMQNDSTSYERAANYGREFMLERYDIKIVSNQVLDLLERIRA
ncbi:glycosyltransferase [Glutamicibacter protophormiae]|uniref:glycosyltransferase n=1 Tax=Glutamicibacter protophormiae TaxID=37930 RepID=UPI002A80AD97|nr:glycosyltransferase [Glutamicibacter protophormiae]WPR66131.1 glycosyltransferase [Glutamicibacter protophormiae]WPR69628.1 glycosyltransferase [Glutamicibacter protophormiae]